MRLSFTYGLVGLASIASAQNSSSSLASLLASTPSLSNLTTAVQAYPALVAALSNATNITILAPSNTAFSALNLTGLSAGRIQAILQYHVLQGIYPASAIPNKLAFVGTLQNNASYTNVTGGQKVGVVKNGNNVTIYSGAGTTPKSVSTVTTADQNFTGGVVHVIDKVLSLPSNISTTAVAANLTAAVGALTRANLAGPLQALKDVTVFVPNNAAFQSIGSALPNLTTQQLSSILSYHVVQGTVGYSSVLTNGQTLNTLANSSLTITTTNGTVYVNSAKVLIADVLVANGVVHVIDNVLNPANSTAKPNTSATTQAPAFSGASSATNVPFTSGVSTPTAAGGASSSRAASASSTAAAPAITAAVGMGALFGGAAAVMAL